MGEFGQGVLHDRHPSIPECRAASSHWAKPREQAPQAASTLSKPRLLTQPRPCPVGVGPVNGESVEASAGAAGSTQAHIQHPIAAFRQQLRHPIQRHAAPVWAEEQDQRRLVDTNRVKAVRQQRHPVTSRDHQVAFNPHRMRVAGLHTERSTQKAHQRVPIAQFEAGTKRSWRTPN